MGQAAVLAARQVHLRRVAGDHGLAAEADPRQEHLHLFRRGVLGFIQDNEGMVQRAAAHVGQRGDLDRLLFEQALHLLDAHQSVERVIQRAQIRGDFLGQVAGQESQPFASFDGRPCQHQS
ncbi:hypothetical protein G6F68_019156 [Rhizopus microsporus]|nr:hypothetical protein G6F68_019156 [Rhizopus microsporus]